ncbi:MAG: galactokinase [Bryobacteraceae bacterium]
MVASLRRRFRAIFHREPRIYRAPGRVNLIGEHTDYNEGFVMPAAIDFAAWAAAAPRPDRQVRIFSFNLGEHHQFDLDAPRPRRTWSDYVEGVAVMLERAGFRLEGADLAVDSTVPLGGGLSSSAALEVSSAKALLAGRPCEPLELARICQQAESEFAGMRCGIMDQFAACLGREGHALLLDCRSLEYEALPLPEQIALVACNTMVKHELATGEYNRRREECEAAARQLGVSHLRDARLDQLDDLPDPLRKRARHVVTENRRALDDAAALRAGVLTVFGRLMNESHASLRDDYEVSCAELDLMVRLAREPDGVSGARMTGGGFGGCVLALVDRGAVEAFTAHVREGYREATGVVPEIHACRAVGGAQEVTEQ